MVQLQIKPFIAFFLVAAAIADAVAQPIANRNGGSRESRPALYVIIFEFVTDICNTESSEGPQEGAVQTPPVPDTWKRRQDLIRFNNSEDLCTLYDIDGSNPWHVVLSSSFYTGTI